MEADPEDLPRVKLVRFPHSLEEKLETQEEVDAQVAALTPAQIAAMDSNKDGRISLAEWNEAVAKAAAGAVALLRVAGQKERSQSLTTRRVLGHPRYRRRTPVRRSVSRPFSRPRLLRSRRVYRRRRY